MGIFSKKIVAPTQEEYNYLVEKYQKVQDDRDSEQKLHEETVKQMKHDNELAKAKTTSDHAIALKEKEFEIKHFKDAELQKSQEEVTEVTKKCAVLENENKMLREITNINSDIIDIKDLVNALIGKLPTVNITSGIGAPAKESKDK